MDCCSISNFCYCFFQVNPVMLVFHPMQHNFKRNTCLYFLQSENKVLETYSKILNNQERVSARYKFEINQIHCWKCDKYWSSEYLCEIDFTIIERCTLSSEKSFGNPLKVVKNAFYFASKALFVLKVIFKFFSWHFGHVAKWFNKRCKIDFKFYDVTAWLTIVIHILHNISRSKCN